VAEAGGLRVFKAKYGIHCETLPQRKKKTKAKHLKAFSFI
jgi:hypothetical protein